MYQKVVVPLDGSQLSECSLGHLEAIAMGCNIPEVVLLRVVEPFTDYELGPLVDVGGEAVIKRENERKDEAAGYISKLVEKLNKKGVSAKGEVILGRADEAILDYGKKNKVDLIIMSTHGRSGISRFAYGSVADRVARHSVVPVLLVTPAGCRIT